MGRQGNGRRWVWAAAMGLVAAAAVALPGRAWAEDTSAAASPWGFSCSGEWFGAYPKFDPLMAKAGAQWIRAFPEWSTLEPKRDVYDWKSADAQIADFKANKLQASGIFCYLAPWASADGSTRTFPVKDIQGWRDYVRSATSRYKDDIKYWEIGNEWNGSFGPGCTPKVYAEMTSTAYEEAQKVDKSIKIGISVANFDIGYVDAVIKAGAADHFNFIAVHPYENVGALEDGGEMGFLSLAGNVRDMLKANKQTQPVELWATEFGYSVPVKADAKGDAKQADILTKSHVLFLVQGFDRLDWFEARGPAYGKGTDLGIIREDWSLRPSYYAYSTMTTQLGATPKYVGWLNVGDGGYGFVFNGAKGAVLVTWAPPSKELKAKFDGAVTVIDELGKETPLAAGSELALSTTPVYVTGLPAASVDLAKGNVSKAYPWGGNYAKATQVSCVLGAVNKDDGLKQTSPGTTAVVNDLTSSCRRTNFKAGGEGHYAYFRVDPQFVPYGTNALNVTIVTKRIDGKQAGMTLSYESKTGYHNAADWWTIPEGDDWQEHTWTLTDANFVGQWGWNFRFDAVSSPNEFLIKEVRVSKAKK